MTDNLNRAHEQARRLARVLVTPHDERACETCVDNLERYVALQLAGEDYAAIMPETAAHLDACVSCAEMYSLVYDTVYAGVPDEAVQAPPPDLRFLKTTPSVSPDGAQLLRDALAGAVERLGSLLRVTLTQPLLDAMAGQPALAVRAATADRGALQLELAEPEMKIERLSLLVDPSRQSPELYTLRIQVEISGREWPVLPGIPLVARFDLQERRVMTDVWGEAVIDDVPGSALLGLQIEIDAEAPTST